MGKHTADKAETPDMPYRASRLLKALGNPKNYAMVRMLLDKETMKVEDLVAALGQPQPVVSQMLRTLRDIEAVRCERKGKNVFYTLKNRKSLAAFFEAIEAYARKASEQGK